MGDLRDSGRRRVLIMLAAASAFPAGAAFAGEPPRITAAELRKLVDKGDAVIIDVRSKAAYDAEHIEGAISLPLGDLEARAGELPKEKLIAAYCT